MTKWGTVPQNGVRMATLVWITPENRPSLYFDFEFLPFRDFQLKNLSRKTAIVARSGILAVMIGSGWNQENLATGSDYRIPAFTFVPFSEFFRWKRPVTCHVGMKSNLGMINLYPPSG
jgi:hypothetical protein